MIHGQGFEGGLITLSSVSYLTPISIEHLILNNIFFVVIVIGIFMALAVPKWL